VHVQYPRLLRRASVPAATTHASCRQSSFSCVLHEST
jgi:hypothetical protein